MLGADNAQLSHIIIALLLCFSIVHLLSETMRVGCYFTYTTSLTLIRLIFKVFWVLFQRIAATRKKSAKTFRVSWMGSGGSRTGLPGLCCSLILSYHPIPTILPSLMLV
jgi:hypothetical protein